MRLVGVDVSEPDCRTLIDLLFRVGRAADLELAQRRNLGLEEEIRVMGLSPAERDALLGVLDDPPDSLLEFRGVLARDRRDRMS